MIKLLLKLTDLCTENNGKDQTSLEIIFNLLPISKLQLKPIQKMYIQLVLNNNKTNRPLFKSVLRTYRHAHF